MPCEKAPVESLTVENARRKEETSYMRKHFAKTMLMILMMLTVLSASAFSAAAESQVYEVSTDDELSTALQNIAAGTDTEATIVLKADLNAPVTAEGSYTTTFGVDGKHITVKSDEGGGEETFLSRVWNSERRLHL